MLKRSDQISCHQVIFIYRSLEKTKFLFKVANLLQGFLGSELVSELPSALPVTVMAGHTPHAPGGSLLSSCATLADGFREVKTELEQEEERLLREIQDCLAFLWSDWLMLFVEIERTLRWKCPVRPGTCE